MMSLPRIDVPSYTCILPSTGQSIQYRPFLVKEQKQLLIAMGGDEQQKIQTVKNIVAACVTDKIDVDRMPAYDLEYLFMQLRIRSVGESVDLILSCGECDNKQNALLDLQTVEVQKPAGHASEIDLGGDLMVTLRDPSIEQIAELKESDSVESIIHLIAGCISAIWKDGEMYAANDYSISDLIEFVENLSPAHLEKLNDFFQTLPHLTHTLNYKCTECGADNEAVLEGLQGFFA